MADIKRVNGPYYKAVVPVAATGKYSGKTDGSEGVASAVFLVNTDGVAGGQVGGYSALVSSSFTRPANTTAYTSGDLVANSTTAGSVVPMTFAVARTAGGTGMIRRARLRKSGTSTASASFRLHLYRATPVTVTNGDNGAWLTSGNADYMGAIDITCDRVFTDGASGNGVPILGSEINFDLPNGVSNIRGLLEARSAYTPGSEEVFTVELEVLQN